MFCPSLPPKDSGFPVMPLHGAAFPAWCWTRGNNKGLDGSRWSAKKAKYLAHGPIHLIGRKLLGQPGILGSCWDKVSVGLALGADGKSISGGKVGHGGVAGKHGRDGKGVVGGTGGRIVKGKKGKVVEVARKAATVFFFGRVC